MDQILVIYAGTKGYLDGVHVNRVPEWETAFLNYFQNERKDVWDLVDQNKNGGKTLTGKDGDEVSETVISAINEFNAKNDFS